MKSFKIIKNSFIFTILGIKRNILAFIGIVALVVLHGALAILLITGPFGFTIVIPIVYLLAITAFMGGYAAYPIIDRYLIAPYAEEESEEFVYLKPDGADSSDQTDQSN